MDVGYLWSAKIFEERCFVLGEKQDIRVKTTNVQDKLIFHQTYIKIVVRVESVSLNERGS